MDGSARARLKGLLSTAAIGFAVATVFVFEQFHAPQWHHLELHSLKIHKPDADAESVVNSTEVSSLAVTERYTKKRKVHRVQHVQLLNQRSFWGLLGAFVLVVGAIVVTSEVKSPSVKHVPKSPKGGDLRSPQAPSKQSSLWTSQLGLRLYCFVGLSTSLLLCGISQEFVMTHWYGVPFGEMASGEQIPSVLFVVLCNRFASAIFAMIVVCMHGDSVWIPPGSMLGSQAAASNVVSLWCQHQSLSYVPFTFQATVHSARLLPVQVLNSLKGERSSVVDYAESLVILLAVSVFGLETHRLEQLHETPGIGIALLLAMLLFDALTPHFQEVLFTTHPEVSIMQHLLVMSSTAVVAILTCLLTSGLLLSCLRFLVVHPEAIVHLCVLAASSTLAQYYIIFTVQQFGPLFFALISSTRQVITVGASALLFQHHITSLASISSVIILGIFVLRALRLQLLAGISDGWTSKEEKSRFFSGDMVPLLICAVGIHIIHCFYAVVQEFLAVHTFKGELFAFPVFNVLLNHSLGSMLAYTVLKLRGLCVVPRGAKLSVLPALSNFFGTFCQHKALYAISFPTQTLMKTLKVIPVMLVGRMLKNRRYSWLDYLDSVVITFIVAYFVWDFQISSSSQSEDEETKSRGFQGILLMIGYLLSDSLTSNLQDHAYQTAHLDPSQMLFILEVISSTVALLTLLCNGDAIEVFRFVCRHPDSLLFVLLLAFTSACGAYVCTVTVNLFGPAVFTLLMVSRQVMSLVISVFAFGHKVDFVQCLCLATVSLVILTSSVRRVAMQRTTTS